tara:strand:- start:425 stop:1471 length:1047 start_codon:yes stop_codon:yes gene_type:complete
MAVNTSRSADWDGLMSSTLENVRGSFADNIWNGRPLHAWLFKKGRRRMVDGGTEIVEPLVYANGNAGWYGEDDIIDVQKTAGHSAASFPWAALYGTVFITGREKLMNSGKEQAINLLDARVTQASETMKNDLSTAAFADTPASADTMLGLGYLINNAAGDGAADVGNIDAATNAFWNSTVKDGTASTGDFGAAGLDTGEKVRKAIRSARNAASDSGNDRADAAFTDLTTYEAVEDSFIQQVRYEDVDSANAGFENVEVSKMPLFWDFDCTAGTVFGINSKYLQIVGHSDRWMEHSGFTKNPLDSTYDSTVGTSVGGVRDAQYDIITTLLQMTTRNRRRHFRINNITIA